MHRETLSESKRTNKTKKSRETKTITVSAFVSQTQVVNLGNEYLLSHLVVPALTFETCLLVNVLKEAA